MAQREIGLKGLNYDLLSFLQNNRRILIISVQEAMIPLFLLAETMENTIETSQYSAMGCSKFSGYWQLVSCRRG
jgi:hypothetical protein